MKTRSYPSPTLLLLAAAISGTCFAGVAHAQTEGVPTDPFLAAELADQAAAANPAGRPHRERAMSLLRELGLPADASFEVLNVNVDRRGGEHVRLQQLAGGVPVKGGVLISHTDARGSYGPYTDALVRGLPRTDPPRVSADDAIFAVERDTRHTMRFAWLPRTRLLIVPIFETRLREGAPPLLADLDREPADDASEATADDLEQVLVGASLVWEVKVLDDPDDGTRFRGSFWHVDASTGAVRERVDAESSALGKSYWTGTMPITTTAVGNSCSHLMHDLDRNIKIIDRDYQNKVTEEVSGPNCDGDDNWGDNQVFAGDAAASYTNRQTAMADAMIGTRVLWNLLSNVFHRQGYNDQWAWMSVNVHEGTGWDDAMYNNINNSVFVGDGPAGTAYRQARDCLGHEHGHGLVDSTVGLGNSGEGGALNESIADIMGEMTDAYFASASYANDDDFVGDIATVASVPAPARSDVPYRNRCSGRNMLVRWDSAKKPAIFWSSSLGNLEVHDGSVANSRAFAILALGASPFIGRATGKADVGAPYSNKLPWGASGIGFEDAAVIAYSAVANHLASDTHQAMRKAMIDAAIDEFGSGSAQHVAVKNAYAAINVGQPAAGTPTSIPAILAVEPNDSLAAAQPLDAQLASPPAGAAPGAPKKLSVLGQGSTDWFEIGTADDTVAARLVPLDLYSSWTIEMYNPWRADEPTMGWTYSSKWFSSRIVKDTADPAGFGEKRYLRVKRLSGAGGYVLQVEKK